MQKPNILYIMCDQLRYDALGINGNKIVKTPNIDALARDGVCFDNAYTTNPVCMPARYTIRSGCESYNTGIFDNCFKPDGTYVRQNCGKYLAEEMRDRGYKTFGVGKFHTNPFNEELGFDVHLRAEEIWYKEYERKEYDEYAKFIAKNASYKHIEQLHGERTEMYYMPQVSPFSREDTMENWATQKAVDFIENSKSDPFFAFVSFIGPHPPFAPPVPYNRMYNPDKMGEPVKSDRSIDFMDEYLPFMNYMTYSEDVDLERYRSLKARYYGDITYIDDCVGKIIEALKKSGKYESTLICFFADHGDNLGDHHSWQKSCFFETSTKVPFILKLSSNCEKNAQNVEQVCLTDGLDCDKSKMKNTRNNELVCLTDLYAIATAVSGNAVLRDGVDVIKSLYDGTSTREILFGFNGFVDTKNLKVMIRKGNFKYIYLFNGNQEQLFDLENDPNETKLVKNSKLLSQFRELLKNKLRSEKGLAPSLDGNGNIKRYERVPIAKKRMKQFDMSQGIYDFLI